LDCIHGKKLAFLRILISREGFGVRVLNFPALFSVCLNFELWYLGKGEVVLLTTVDRLPLGKKIVFYIYDFTNTITTTKPAWKRGMRG